VLKEEIWKELFWHVVEQLLTQFKSSLKLIWDMLMSSKNMFWVKKNILSLLVLKTPNPAPS